MIRKFVNSIGIVALAASLVLTTGCADKKKPQAEEEEAAAAAASGASAASASAPSDMEEDDIPLGNTSSVDSQGRVRKDVVERSAGANAGSDASIVSAALFGFDSSTLDAAARAVLDEVAAKLSKNSSWIVTLEGHCDNRGTEEYNLGLGQRRAEAAKNYLMQKGISASRLDTVSFGEAYPVDARNTEAAWAKNRRVHFAFSKGSAS